MILWYVGLPSELGPRRAAPWGGWCRRVQGPPSNWAESRRPCQDNSDAKMQENKSRQTNQTSWRMLISMFVLFGCLFSRESVTIPREFRCPASPRGWAHARHPNLLHSGLYCFLETLISASNRLILVILDASKLNDLPTCSTAAYTQLFLLDASKEKLRATTLQSNGSSKARNLKQ